MKISIVGATGVVGRHVLTRPVELGHEINAMVLNPEHAAALQRQRVNAFIGDILDPDSLYAALADCDCALHLATAIPRDRISNLLSRWNSRYRIAISNGVYSAAVITSGIFNYGIYNTPGAET